MSQRGPGFGQRGRRQEEPRPARETATILGGGPPGWLTKVLIIAIPVTVVVFGAFVFMFQSLGAARDELDAFLKPVFTAVVSAGWTEESIEGYSTSELNSWFLKNDFDTAVAPWRAFGPMVRYEGVGEFEISTQGTSGSAEAVVKIEFEKGAKAFHVTLRREEGRWYLHGMKLAE